MAKPAISVGVPLTQRPSEELNELACKAATNDVAREELFNHSAFKQIVNIVSAILFAKFGKIGDILTQDDVRSLLLKKLVKGIKHYKGTAPLKIYLISIGKNFYADEYNRVKREVNAIESYLEGQNKFLSERRITQKALVKCALDKVTSYQRNLFKLYFLEQKAVSQIAKEVNKSQSQVYRDLQSLFDKLVQEIETEQGYE